MEETINSFGKISWICGRCSWVENGLCWECGKPKEKRKLFCPPCAKNSVRASIKKYKESDEHKAKYSLYYKKRWKEDIEFKKRKTQLRKEWLARNPQKKEQYKLSRIYRELGL
jgi:predicted amidophosphoribosyltransferase